MKSVTPEKYITVPRLAELLGVSRIAVYKRVRKGQIPAMKIGKMYVITEKTVAGILKRDVTEEGKKQIAAAVRRTVQEYGDVLKKLGEE